MAWNINRIIVNGRLTKDVDLRVSQNGLSVCEVSIAVAGLKDEVSFFNCKAFGNQAENLSKYCSKGSFISIDGSLKQERWEKNGVKNSKVVIMIDRVEFLNTGNKESTFNDKDYQPFSDEVPF